jgi:leucyl aminopeptidase
MPISVSVAHGQIQQHAADAVVVNLFQGVAQPGGATAAVDAALGGQIAAVIAAGDFKGRRGEVLTLYSRGALPAPRVLVVGLGQAESFDLDGVRRAAASAALAARKLGLRRLASIVHGAGFAGLDAAAAAQATVEGTVLALYEFKAYKSAGPDPEAPPPLADLTLVELDGGRLEAVRAGAAAGAGVAAGVELARDLANHPGNVATPTYLGEQAQALAARHGMRAELWEPERMRAEGMGALLSVAAGSAQPARFIVVEHAPAGTGSQAPLVLVGKAVTFDAGGISLKPGPKMGAMKYDMAGGAAVLGALEAVGRLGLNKRVIGLVGATENLPGGTATRPGDIVKALNGTTIEVLNTDAEGRMVLADCLSYAQRLNPAAVVDLATLTGAIVIALGPQMAGLFANNDPLAAQLAAAASATGEPLWRMPLVALYDDMVKSDCADIQNVADTSPAPAGSIYGAKFLERFVTYPWAHLDIAATAWDAKDVPYLPKGATGFGVRLLVEWLRTA